MRKKRGASFAWTSSFVVFWLQGPILWFISSSLRQAIAATDPDRSTWIDGVALVVFVIGLGFEAIGDWQLARFKQDQANRGKVMRSGLWRYTCHPNYFRDAVAFIPWKPKQN